MPRLPGLRILARQGPIAYRGPSGISGSVVGLLADLQQPQDETPRPAATPSGQVLTATIGRMTPRAVPAVARPDPLTLVATIGPMRVKGAVAMPGLRLVAYIGSLARQTRSVAMPGLSLVGLQGNVTATSRTTESVFDPQAIPSWQSGLLGRITGRWNRLSEPQRTVQVHGLRTPEAQAVRLHTGATTSVVAWSVFLSFDRSQTPRQYVAVLQLYPVRETVPASVDLAIALQSGSDVRVLRIGTSRAPSGGVARTTVTAADWQWIEDRAGLRDMTVAVLDAANANVDLTDLTLRSV